MNTFKPLPRLANETKVLEPSSELLQSGKNRMAYWFCSLSIIVVLLYLPIFFSISNLVGTIGIFSIGILIVSVYRLRKTNRPEPVLKPTFSLLIFFIVFALIYQSPINPSGYLLWSDMFFLFFIGSLLGDWIFYNCFLWFGHYFFIPTLWI